MPTSQVQLALPFAAELQDDTSPSSLSDESSTDEEEEEDHTSSSSSNSVEDSDHSETDEEEPSEDETPRTRLSDLREGARAAPATSLPESSELLIGVVVAGTLSFRIAGRITFVELLGCVGRVGTGSALADDVRGLAAARGCQVLLLRARESKKVLNFWSACGYKDISQAGCQRWMTRPRLL